MPSILFRADADIKSGTGDLFSLIHLSEYFKGWKKYFVTKNTKVARNIIKSKNRNVKFIPRAITTAKEIRFLNDFIKRKKIDAIFLEITAKGIGCYKNIAAPFKACVDFYGDIPPNFDLVVNWDIGAKLLYDKKRYPNTRFLLGPQYVFLGKSLLEKANRLRLKRTRPRKPKNIVMFLGGLDKFDFTQRLIKSLEVIDTDLNLNVITGVGYKYKKRLKEHLKKAEFPRYRIRQNVRDMYREYEKADLIIVSGGLSLFESIAFRKPVATIAIYEHQIKRSISFEKMKAVLYLGFRKCNMPKLEKAISDYRFNCFRDAFLADSIPQIIYERLGCKT